MTTLSIFDHAGAFAENKDIARKMRVESILPALEMKQTVTLDFAQVSGTTQSFVHALISELFRKFGSGVMDQLNFKNCNETVQKIIILVCDYMQEAEGGR